MEEDPTAAMISDGSIRRVKLSLATNQEICTYSVSEFPVSHPSQLLDNPSLGLPLQLGSCESCGATEINKCEGHFGFVELPVPVYHPCHVTELRKILNMICFKCLRLKKGKGKQKSGKERNFTSCSYCQELPPLCVAESKRADGAHCLELRAPPRARLEDCFWDFLDQYGFQTNGSSRHRTLLPCEAQSILKTISEDTRTRLAARGYVPQDGFVMSCLPIPPNCLHALNLSDDKAILHSSDTSMSELKKVLRKIEQIKGSRLGFANFEAHEAESNDLQTVIAEYMNLRGTTKGPKDVIFRTEAPTKQWLQKMKSLFISKGSCFSSRGVITGDPYIPVDVVGVPDEVARKMSVEERVTERNIVQLQSMVDRGLCLTYKDVDSVVYSLSIQLTTKSRTVLKVGETVNRRVLDGDVVFLNRPPSTDKHSIQAFHVHVHDGRTIKINPLVCGPLGADFDGDCVHIFYPGSVAAKAEAIELFSVEKQLVSSHNRKLNIQLKHDCTLALKVMSGRMFSRKEASQLAMFTSGRLPGRPGPGGPHWSFSQILQSIQVAVPHALAKDSVEALVSRITSSILSEKGPREVIRFLNLLQPLLMESLLLAGFSISLRDFDVPDSVLKPIQNRVHKSSVALGRFREPIVDFIMQCTALGFMVDPKSNSAMDKVVEQLGFLGQQLHHSGRLYSSSLVEDCYSKSLNKFCRSTDGARSSEANGVVRSSFYHGLNPYEELVHSISVREKIIRSSGGLTEPGTLFKNMMALLRDVITFYDGTIRTKCSSSIVQFGSTDASTATPGDPAGILAATAIANAAYKAVLDPSGSNVTSWGLMKEVLLTRSGSTAHTNDRKIILYLNNCSCGKEFCKEKAALSVQDCLKRITLEDCATEFSIQHQQQATEAAQGLVGHIHIDKKQLNQIKISMGDIIYKCQEVFQRYRQKRGQLSQILKRTTLISSECLCHQDPNDAELFQVPCLQFFLSKSIIAQLSESFERAVHLLTSTVCPLLLETVVKGDPRVHEATVIWVEPELTCWIQNSSAERNGELAVEVTMEKSAAAQGGGCWTAAMDACLPVMDLIDTTRSIPHGIQQVREVFGIYYAFDRAMQYLSKAVGTVSRGVLKEHLMVVANSMTCTGSLHGFNSCGYKAIFQSLKAQAPFMEATLSRPIKCFEKGAEKLQSDPLGNVVSSCSWGRSAAIGTGSDFQIHWNDENLAASNGDLQGYGVYDFLTAVPTTAIVATEDNTIHHNCYLYDADCLQEDEVANSCENAMIQWTDEGRKEVNLWSPGSEGRSARNSSQEFHQRRTKSDWSSGAEWQNAKPSRHEGNAWGPGSSAVAGPSRASAWNKNISDACHGGGSAVWKPQGSHQRGSSSNWRSKKNRYARPRDDLNFTPMEEQIYAHVDPIAQKVKRIIRGSSDGVKLSPEDEMFIVRNVLTYHPDRQKKMAGTGSYIMVARHQVFRSSRCFYVVSSDGSRLDFSYKKCLENFIRIQYPDAAVSFSRKYFK